MVRQTRIIKDTKTGLYFGGCREWSDVCDRTVEWKTDHVKGAARYSMSLNDTTSINFAIKRLQLGYARNTFVVETFDTTVLNMNSKLPTEVFALMYGCVDLDEEIVHQLYTTKELGISQARRTAHGVLEDNPEDYADVILTDTIDDNGNNVVIIATQTTECEWWRVVPMKVWDK